MLKSIAQAAPPSCDLLLFTAVYYGTSKTLSHAPNPNCSVAFVNDLKKHHTPGWKQVQFFDKDFYSLERSAHLTKIPTWMDRPVIYVDFKISGRKVKAFDMPAGTYDVAVAKHPSFGSRSVRLEIGKTISHMKTRSMKSNVFEDLELQKQRISKTDFNMDASDLMPDTYYIAWRNTTKAKYFAALWYDEVARISMREQTNFNYIANVSGVALKYIKHSL